MRHSKESDVYMKTSVREGKAVVQLPIKNANINKNVI